MIKIDIDRAKNLVAHPKRRKKRDELYNDIDGGSPYATLNQEGEAKRGEIKAEDDKLQIDIDNCQNEIELKEVMIKGGLL